MGHAANYAILGSMPYEITPDEKAGFRVILNKARLGSDALLGEYRSLIEAEAFVKAMRTIGVIGTSKTPRRPPKAR